MNRQYIAPDGWRLEWDLDATPGNITAYDAQGIKSWHISGTIDDKRLQRELEHFRADHGLQQGTFWSVYRPREREDPGPDYRALG